MDGAKRQAVILALMRELQEQDSWCGETHVQKSSHFLQDGLAVPLEIEFIMYKHGPFSFELRELLGELRASQLLEVVPSPPYGPQLHPSASGISLLNRFPKTLSRYEQQIRFVATKLASRHVADLERVGTALYVTRLLPGKSEQRRTEEFLLHKPRVEEEAALAAIKEVDELLAAAPNSQP